MNDHDQLVGLITRGDFVRALRLNPPGGTDRGGSRQRDLTVAFPDEPFHSAHDKMLERGDGPRPVVERDNSRKRVSYRWRAAILSQRLKIHEQETIRQKSGPSRSVARAKGD